MDSIKDIFTQAALPISLEIFPPQGELAYQTARDMVAQLAPLGPSFISVTSSAGGSGNMRATNDVAALLQDEFAVPSVAHLTCTHLERGQVGAVMDELQARGIEGVLALRGDLTPGAPVAFPYAKDLIPLLKERGFTVGAAAYPEGHITCSDDRVSIGHLKCKQDAGADFFITQLFFDNNVLYRFREQAAAAGITAPISCGIMPFLSKRQIQRMVFMCGASLPSPIIKLLAKHEDNPDDLRKAGIEYATNQLLDLAAHGVDALHVYTMNRPAIAQAALETLHAAGFGVGQPCA